MTANKLTNDAMSTNRKMIVRLESCFLAICLISSGLAVNMVIQNNIKVDKVKLDQMYINGKAGVAVFLVIIKVIKATNRQISKRLCAGIL